MSVCVCVCVATGRQTTEQNVQREKEVFVFVCAHVTGRQTEQNERVYERC